MSKEINENKELSTEEMAEIVKSMDKNSAWDGSTWIFLLLIMLFGFGGWSQPDNKDHELRERVARLEGQMSMIGGKNK